MRTRDLLRRPWVMRSLAFLAALVIRGWMATLRHRFQSIGPDMNPHRLDPKQRVIYAFWHENMLLMAYQFGRPDVYVLISDHADGQLITHIAARFRLRTVRGSKTRNGAKALLEMFRLARDAHIVLTPDGPKGPRRTVQPGLTFLAAKTGMPIVPVGVGYDRPWRAQSWDRLALPVPFRRARTVTGEAIHVPPDADREQLEAYRLRVERAMHAVDEIAEKWAASGVWPASAEQVNTKRDEAA